MATTAGIEATPSVIEPTPVLPQDTASVINSSPIVSSVTMQVTSEVVTMASSAGTSPGITSGTSNSTEDTQDVTDASTQGSSSSLSSLDVTSEGIPESSLSMTSVAPSMSNPTFESSDAALDASSALVASAAVTSDVPLSSVSVTSANIDAASAWNSSASDNVLSSILYTPTPSLNFSDTDIDSFASNFASSIHAPSESDFMSGTINIETTPSVALPDQSEHLNFSASSLLASTVQSSVNDFNATYTSASFFATPAPSVINEELVSSQFPNMTSAGSDHVVPPPNDTMPYTTSPSMVTASIEPTSTLNLTSSHIVHISNDTLTNDTNDLEMNGTNYLTPSFTDNDLSNVSTTPMMTTINADGDNSLTTPPPDISVTMPTNMSGSGNESVTMPLYTNITGEDVTDNNDNQTDVIQSTTSMNASDMWPNDNTTNDPMASAFLTTVGLDENATFAMHNSTEQPVVNASSHAMDNNSTSTVEYGSSYQNASVENSTIDMMHNVTMDSNLNDTIVEAGHMTTPSYFNFTATVSANDNGNMTTSHEMWNSTLVTDDPLNVTDGDYNVTNTIGNVTYSPVNITSNETGISDSPFNVTGIPEYNNVTNTPINVTFSTENVTQNVSDSITTYNYSFNDTVTTPSYFNESTSNSTVHVTMNPDNATQNYVFSTASDVTDSSNVTELYNVTDVYSDGNGTYEVTTASSNVTTETFLNTTAAVINSTESMNLTSPDVSTEASFNNVTVTTESANVTDFVNGSDIMTESSDNVTTPYTETDDVISTTTAYQATDNTTSADVNTTSAFSNTTDEYVTFNVTETTEMTTTEFETTIAPLLLNTSDLYQEFWIRSGKGLQKCIHCCH